MSATFANWVRFEPSRCTLGGARVKRFFAPPDREGCDAKSNE